MSEVLEDLRARARQRAARVVLPETGDARIVAARRALEDEGLAEVIWVEAPAEDPRFDDVAAHLLARRKHKGLSEGEAARMAADPLVFGAGLCALGHADCGVSGAAHATADVIRAGLHCIGTSPTTPLVSSMFLMARGDEVLSFADCGVLPAPSPEQLVHVAYATAQNHRLLTLEAARVAFLSFSTRGSAAHERVHEVRAACDAFQRAHPEILADGELQFDAACVPEVAAKKCPDSALAGRANVLVFPDLDAGNIAYKVAQRLGGFAAYGPILQGFGAPWLDLSRGCASEDVVWVSVIASAMLATDTR